MKLQMKFFFAPRPRLTLAEIETLTRQRGTFGLNGRSRDWWVRQCEAGVFEAYAPTGLPGTVDPSGNQSQWYIYADAFLPWLAEQEGHQREALDVNKVLGIQAMAA